MKRVILILMVLGIMVGSLYSQVSSLEGSGTETDPYQVQDLQDLITISENSTIWDKHFLQTNDIDASATSEINQEAGFSPIGNNTTSFTGSYDGQGFTISDLYINRPSTNFIGLFGYTQSAEISNLGIVDAETTGDERVGGLVGYSHSSTISNSYATGAVTGNGNYVGGLVGYAYTFSSSLSISNSYATGAVTGNGSFVGGLVGYASSSFSSAPISNSYATGAVTGNRSVGGLVGFASSRVTLNNSYAAGAVSGNSSIGGLVGISWSTISNSYATGSVSGIEKVGGLVGYSYSAINNSYANGYVNATDGYAGGLVGFGNDEEANNSFWDIETSGQTLSVGGIGKTTEEMKDATTYLSVGWDFSNLWFLDPVLNDGYPFHKMNDLIINNSILTLSTNVSVTPTISFEVVPGYENFELYYGTQSNLDINLISLSPITNTVIYTFDNTLDYFTNYYWKVVLYDDNDDATSLYYTFRTIPSELEGYGTETDPYLIADLEDLITLSEESTLWSSYFLQTADIDASNISDLNYGTGFSPIGYRDSYGNEEETNPFTGTYDGNNFSISNLQLSSTSAMIYSGLFGYTNNATIKNLTISDFIVNDNNFSGGALVGQADSTSILNCHSDGAISGFEMGGLIYMCNYSLIENCSSSVNISNGDMSGGLIGSASSSTISNCFATGNITNGSMMLGGLIGSCGSSTISDCYASGDVQGSDILGGLIGSCGGSIISDCYATGNVIGEYMGIGGLIGDNSRTSIFDSYSTGDVQGGDMGVGGFIGSNSISGSYQSSSSLFSTISNCYATGNVNGVSEIGGFIGSSYVANANGTGMIFESTITNCYALGHITSTSNDLYMNGAGGFIGRSIISYRSKLTIDQCYALGSVSGVNYVGGLIGEWSTNSSSSTLTLTNSYAIGSVIGNNYVGGLIGYSNGSTVSKKILNCYSIGQVSGNDYVGGLIGWNESRQTQTSTTQVDNCFALGDIIGTGNYIGGLIGQNSNTLYNTTSPSESIIQNCFALGSLRGIDYVGGFIGSFGVNETSTPWIINDSYAMVTVNGTDNVGGFIGAGLESAVTNSFWSPQFSGQNESAGGTQKSIEEMRNVSTFTDFGWDFVNEDLNGTNDYWAIDTEKNSGFPFLADIFNIVPVMRDCIYPPNQANNIPLTDNLLWSTNSYDMTTGYRIYLGTDYPPNNILSGFDLGLNNIYNFTNLEPNVTYYWRVIPYNDDVSALNCPIWSFNTGSSEISSGSGGYDTIDKLPINNDYNYSCSQSIFLQSDINKSNRQIEKLTFYLTDDYNLVGVNQWKVYLGHTTKTEFIDSNDWLSFSEELIEVADVTIDDEIKINHIEIDLEIPFSYNNIDNLVVAIIDYSPDTSGSIDFYTVEKESNRSLSLGSNEVIDVNNLFAGETHYAIPKINFTFNESSTSYSGVVKNTQNQPIANASLYNESMGIFRTNSSGIFTLWGVEPNTYQIDVSAQWYESQTIDIEVIEGETHYLEITLLEDLLPASSLTATLAEDLTTVELTWTQPTLARVVNSSKQATRHFTKEKVGLDEKQTHEQRTDQPDLVYNLYLYIAEDENIPANWVEIASNLDALTYSDTSFQNLDLGTFYWAVQAVYPNDRVAQLTLSNEIVKQPYLEAEGDLIIDFGNLILTNTTDYIDITIQNTGTANLIISDISSPETAFNLIYDSADFIIEPNTSMILQVNFEPESPGIYVSDLVISNNSINEPNLTLTLRGLCQYIPPANPDGVQVTMVNNTAEISWNPVSEDIYENPITPDLYIIYFNGLNTQDDNHFYYLGATNQLSYNHINVGAFSEFMFYRVKAYVDVDNAVLSHINDLVSQKRKVSLKEVESLIRNRKGKAILKD